MTYESSIWSCQPGRIPPDIHVDVAHAMQQHIIGKLAVVLPVLQLIHRLYRYCIVSRQSYSAHDGSPDKVSSVYFIILIHTCPLLLQK